ncbi:MAG: hypoxanthine phosphoribosyltransferase [Bacteriovoracaceae bacterium]
MIEELISQEEIHEKVKELGLQINEDYKDKDLLVLGVLNGAFLFCADLVRQIKLAHTIDFISVSSYGDETVSSGSVTIEHKPKKPIESKDILLVEDIIDTGNTVDYLIKTLSAMGARSIRVASLLSKPSRREVEVPIHYKGFDIDDLFVIGYGMDMAGSYRGLPFIGVYKDD